jgi:hypothetical protein
LGARQRSAMRSRRNLLRSRLAVSALVAVAVAALAILPLDSLAAKASTLQMSSDNSVSSWYPNEPALSPSDVSDGDFGQLFDTQLNGQVYAQPLIDQPTVLAVTENDYAYGLNATSGAIEWQDNFGPDADPLAQIGCADIGTNLGITGTPVIDPSNNVAYFVAATDGGPSGATEWFMHAVNVATGTTATGWTASGVQIEGHSDGDPSITFNGEYQTQRPGLVLVNGVVYAAFGSQCDYGDWEGWLVGVSETSATITTMWSSEEDVSITGSFQPGAGIWQSGSAPVVDSNGDIFVATGNGFVPGNPEPGTNTSVSTFGEAVIELHTPTNEPTGHLQVADWFIPYNAVALNSQDGDLGSGGPVALPASMGSSQEPNVMLEVGKQGELYVLNQTSLGGFEEGPSGTDDVPAEVNLSGGVWSKPAVWPGNGGYVYVPTAGTAGFATNGGSLDALQRTVNGSGVVSFQLVGQTVNSGDTFGYGSGQPIVTSNGTTSGSAVVWIIHSNNSSGADSQLEAFNAEPVNPGSSGTMEEIWQSGTFTSTVFSEPGVDSGIVYVGTKDGTLLAFGALPSTTPALSGSNVSFAPTIVSQSTVESATFTARAATTVSSLEVAGSAFAMGTPAPSLPVSLSPGQSISVPLTFTPNALGDDPGQLTANFAGATSTISLDGQGVTSSATLSMSPSEVNFGLQPIAGSTVNTPVTFTNMSANPITITGLRDPVLPFTTTNLPATGQILEPNGQANDSITITVSFAPPGSSGDFVHAFNGVFTLDTTIGSNAEDFGLAIAGTAAPPAQITTIPNTLNFGDVDVGSDATMTFELGDQGGFPLTIISSTPPSSGGFSALTNPLNDIIAADTADVESVQFAPTATGPASSTWLLEGNDGDGVQTVTMSGIGVNPVSSPPPSSPPVSPAPPVPVTLTITTVTGRIGSPLTLGTSGDSNGGVLSYIVRDGTATGCAVSGDKLRAKSKGTCEVTATKSANGSSPAVSSSPTTITFDGTALVKAAATLTVLFTGTNSALSSADTSALARLTKKLKPGEEVTCTGYAKGQTALALRRANSVARYLTRHIKIHVTSAIVTNVAVDKAVVRVL